MRVSEIMKKQFIADFCGFSCAVDGILGPATKKALERLEKALSSNDKLVSDRYRLVTDNVFGTIDSWIGPGAFSLIAYSEGGGRAYYDRECAMGCIPSPQSGITIGLGFDCCYESPERLRRYWGNKLKPSVIDVLAKSHGKYGESAAKFLAKLSLLIPYETACIVLAQQMNDMVPDVIQWITGGKSDMPNITNEQFGVLLSLLYNRGFSVAGDRRKEMRQIQSDLRSGKTKDVGEHLRSMKRLWEGLGGLQRRREAEARLWDDEEANKG